MQGEVPPCIYRKKKKKKKPFDFLFSAADGPFYRGSFCPGQKSECDCYHPLVAQGPLETAAPPTLWLLLADKVFCSVKEGPNHCSFML